MRNVVIIAILFISLTPIGIFFWKASAATETVIQVSTTDDEINEDGDCSLREAIRAANMDTAVDTCLAGSGTDAIVVPPGIYSLTISDAIEENAALTGDLDILQNVSITGAGEDITIIDGNGIDRVFQLPYAATQVTIVDLTIRGGDLGRGIGPQYSGGAISLISGSALTLTQVTITDNTASYGHDILQSGNGGGIYNNGGTAVLNHVTVSHNKAGFAGGIYNGGTLMLINSAVQDNESTYYGGGIQSNSDPLYSMGLILDSSTVSGNIAGTNGGGLYINGGLGNVENSSISSNRANNYLGGGVWVYYEGAVVTITHSTIASNFAGTGGGIFNTHQQGALILPTAVNTIQAPNQNHNIFLKNTIVANNNGNDCGTSLTADLPLSLGYSLASDTSCGFGNPTDKVDTDPMLGPLQDNGGFTFTQALLYGSPAIDQGNCNDASNIQVTTDQRGVVRPQPDGGDCDMGAFEAVPNSNADLTLNKSASPTSAEMGALVTYTLNVINAGPQAVTNVAVTDTLPANVSYFSAAGSGWNCGHASGVVSCIRPTLLAAGLAAPTIEIQVTVPLASGVITNTAVTNVTWPNLDPNKSDNIASAPVIVLPPPQPDADLSLSKIDTPDPVIAGTSLNYTLSVDNAGPDAATAITVTDTLPSGTTFLAAIGDGWACQHTAGIVTCTRASLAVTTAPAIALTVLSPVSEGNITNTAVVAAATNDPNPTDNATSAQTTITPPPVEQADLSISKQVNSNSVAAGRPLTYTLTVTNTGPSTTSSVAVVDILPTGMTFQNASGTGWICNHVSGTVTCTRATLAVEAAPAIVLIMLAPTGSGTVTNSASVSSALSDPQPGNNTASAETVVEPVYWIYLPVIFK